MKHLLLLILIITTPVMGKNLIKFGINDFYKENPEGYFYYNPVKVGAQAFYHPLQIVIEGGFGVLYNMKIDTFDWSKGFNNLHKSLGNPIKAIDDYGWKRFFWNEFIPHTGKNQNYLPNYFWHFLSQGMRTRLMKEYYIHNNYPYPTALAWLSAYTLHYFNEVIQAAKFSQQKASIDALPDMLFFDWLGAVVFSFSPVNEFMTKYFHLKEWSYQTQLNPVTNRLTNNGQLYWVRVDLFGPLSLSIVTGELLTTLNLTWTIANHHQLSLGTGGKVKVFLADDDKQGDTSISGMVFNIGAYYSINDNPVVAFAYEPQDTTKQKLKPEFANEYTEKFTLNIYPGLVDFNGFKPGFTLSFQKDAFFIGISSGSWPLGFIISTPQDEKYLNSI